MSTMISQFLVFIFLLFCCNFNLQLIESNHTFRPKTQLNLVLNQSFIISKRQIYNIDNLRNYVNEIAKEKMEQDLKRRNYGPSLSDQVDQELKKGKNGLSSSDKFIIFVFYIFF